MNAFYFKISEFRKKCIESVAPSSFFYISSTLYTKLMSTMTELNTQEWDDVLKFQKHVPESTEELFHYLWFLNAMARYECFVKKEYQSAGKLTDTISYLASGIFSKDFNEDNLEKRSLIFILALNYTRLSFYNKNYPECVKQLNHLKSFFQNSQDSNWESFPEDLRLLLNNYADTLLVKMTEEQKDYFIQKMNKIEDKLQQQVSI